MTALPYQPGHPALAEQVWWVMNHDLGDSMAFLETFRTWVESGDLDLMLTCFSDTIEDRKEALRMSR
jgi:hypothetical protein